jgi:predicted transposase/invertase (TIGR01784 family)
MAKKPRVLISFDYALKGLLRNKANFDVLEGFLSELLMQDVTVRNILESESNQTHSADKQNKVDIMVEDAQGELIIVELQFEIEFDYLQRMLYGASKAVTEYMTQGTPYQEVRKIYAIHVVYFDLGQGDGYVYHGKTVFRNLHNSDDILLLSARQRQQFRQVAAGDLYPEYYILKINHFDEVAKSTLDEWVYFLKTNTIKDEFTAKGLDKARKLLAYEQLTPKERAEYDALQAVRSHNLSMIASAEDKTREKFEPIIAEKDAALAEKDAIITEKDAALAAEREALAEKDAALAEKDAALARALAELAALKKQ